MKKVDSGEYAVAIAMQPVDVQDVFSIADEGGIMPPSLPGLNQNPHGLLVHRLG